MSNIKIQLAGGVRRPRPKKHYKEQETRVRPTKALPVAKISVNNTLAPVKKKALKISKTDVANLRSIIGDNVDNIQQLLEQGQFEAATNDMHKVLLQTLVDVLPYAEVAVRESEGKKGIYQINSLTSMILETLNSARAQSDRGQLAQHLIERVVQPVFKQMAESIVREFMTLESDLQNSPKSKTSEIVRDTRTRLADSFQQNYHSLTQSIMTNMAG